MSEHLILEQPVTRYSLKFNASHCVQLTDDEFAALRSLPVISKNVGAIL